MSYTRTENSNEIHWASDSTVILLNETKIPLDPYTRNRRGCKDQTKAQSETEANNVRVTSTTTVTSSSTISISNGGGHSHRLPSNLGSAKKESSSQLAHGNGIKDQGHSNPGTHVLQYVSFPPYKPGRKTITIRERLSNSKECCRRLRFNFATGLRKVGARVANGVVAIGGFYKTAVGTRKWESECKTEFWEETKVKVMEENMVVPLESGPPQAYNPNPSLDNRSASTPDWETPLEGNKFVLDTGTAISSNDGEVSDGGNTDEEIDDREIAERLKIDTLSDAELAQLVRLSRRHGKMWSAKMGEDDIDPLLGKARAKLDTVVEMVPEE